MGVFRFFEKNKAEPTDEQKKWNKMWDLWAEGRADSPYACKATRKFAKCI